MDEGNDIVAIGGAQGTGAAAGVMHSRVMVWVYKTLPLLASLAVAAASFALSFVALRDVAADSDAVAGHLAWLVPIVIDGGILCASAVIWSQAALGRRRHRFPMLVVFALVVISVVVNAAHAGDGLLAKLIAALPPLVLLATLELVALSTAHYTGGTSDTGATDSGTVPRNDTVHHAPTPEATSVAVSTAAVPRTAVAGSRSTKPSAVKRPTSAGTRAAGKQRSTPATDTPATRVDALVDSVVTDDIDAELAEMTGQVGERPRRVRATPPE